MKSRLILLSFLFVCCAKAATPPTTQMLPNELSPDQILNGEYRYPPSPAVEVHEVWDGLAKERLTKVPPPGIHPRMLISPEDLPDLRKRLKETVAGRALLATLRSRVSAALGEKSTFGKELYEALATGDVDRSNTILDAHKELFGSIGHYQFYVPTALSMEALDALISEDDVRGKKVGAALATWAKMIEPVIEEDLQQPLAGDIWRIVPTTQPTKHALEKADFRAMLGTQHIGYAYDFAYNFMSDDQRSAVRRVIAKVTAGRVWMGAEQPHHFRNWNWVMCGMGQPLLSLAIEGEEGFDPRVYKLGVQIARDYLAYGIAPAGDATEAVGYMNFGLVWGTPFFVAASRRGDNLLVQSHHRALIDWYIQCMQPFGGLWESHGDGGDGGPSIWNLSMWKYFFPDDPKIDFLWQNYVKGAKGKPYEGTFHIVEPLLWATDGRKDEAGKPIDYADGAKLNMPLTWFDPLRSSLIARSAWSADAADLEFECRTDSVDASHEHADRGNFTLSALGREWARESFRSIETRHHNCVLIDGMGEGFWPGPGKWIGMQDQGWALVAACDAKPAYDWWWPKEITTEDPASFIRYSFSRWNSYKTDSDKFHKDYRGFAIEKDDRPSVVAHFTGFGDGDPRMWDEDAWPVRLPHNPVERAFRTIAFVRQGKPYVVVVDDIQKDDHERLYEWLMLPGPNTDMASIKDNDIVLCDATVARDEAGVPKPKQGDRELLVRVLQMSDPALPHDYQARPSMRLESFEKKDTTSLDGRSFGMDKRLVIPSRSVTPNFKILLFPMRAGEPLPTTTWNADRTAVTLQWQDQKDELRFDPGSDGRTRVAVSRGGQSAAQLN